MYRVFLFYVTLNGGTDPMIRVWCVGMYGRDGVVPSTQERVQSGPASLVKTREVNLVYRTGSREVPEPVYPKPRFVETGPQLMEENLFPDADRDRQPELRRLHHPAPRHILDVFDEVTPDVYSLVPQSVPLPDGSR